MQVTTFHDSRIRGCALLLVALLIVAHVAAGVAAVGYYDTYRDLYYASGIASGASFPLAGPLIYNTIHVGPVWWYLLGAAAALGGSLTAAHVLALVLAALKYPLAWQLGRRLGGERLGLLFVVAMAMPGWSLLSVAASTHSSVVESAVLCGGLAALRYRERPGAFRAAVLGLAASLMLHAHPTALPTALTLIVLAALRLPRSSASAGHVAALVASGLLPLLPYAWQQWNADFADIAALGNYADSTLGAPVLPRLLPLFDGLALYGPEYVWRYWLGLPEAVVRALELGHAGLLVAAAFGMAMLLARRAGAHRALLAICLFLLCAQVVFALALRPITPFWMIYAALPSLALAVALGLEALFARATVPWRRKVALGVAALCAALWPLTNVIALIGITRHPDTVWAEVLEPGQQGLMNIVEQHRDRQRVTIPRVGIRGIESLAAQDCGPITTYGHLAHLIDVSFGVGRSQSCGGVRDVRLGGGLGWKARDNFALTPGAWQSSGAVPARWWRGLGYSPLAALWTDGISLPIVTPETYPPRKPAFAPETFEITGRTLGDQLVIVANRLDGYYPFDVVTAQAGGALLQPLYKDSVLRVYRSPRGAGDAVWRLSIHGARPVIDVMVVNAHPG